jgi:hypothetical protein
MSLTRRLAAGLPSAGVIAFAAVAFTGVPAMAATADAHGPAARPAVTASPCADSSRDKCDYVNNATPGSDNATPGGTVGDDTAGNDNAGNDNAGNGYGDTGAGTGNNDTRGHHSGYGGESPATTPPTGNTDTVPPGGGVSPATNSPTPATPGGGGVSPAGTLPVTG